MRRRVVSLTFLLVLASAALGQTGSIAGRVTARATGEPLSPVNVAIYAPDGSGAGSGGTDGDGRYTVPGLAPGSYRAVVHFHAGFLSQVYDGVTCGFSCDIPAGTPIVVTADATTGNIDFALDLGGTMTGVVTDAAAGTGLAPVVVRAHGAGGVADAYTDANGVYTIPALPTATYFVATYSEIGYVDELYDDIPCFPSLSCDIQGGTPVSVTAGETTAGINLPLSEGGVIAGRVTDDATGAPLAGVYLSAYQSSGEHAEDAYTDADGNFRVIGLPSGDYFLKAGELPGYVAEVYDGIVCPAGFFSCAVSTGTPISVTLGNTTSGIDIDLTLGGSIEGTIVDGDGAPIADVQVSAYTSAGRFVTSGQTDASGHYAIAGLASGNYFARTSNSGGYVNVLYDGIACSGCRVTEGTPIAVTAPAAHTGIDFTLVPGAEIRGTVTDASTGAPLAGILVSVFTPAGAGEDGTATDASGNYAVTNLAAGGYVVRTRNSAGYVDELYANRVCVSCDVRTGDVIDVTAGGTTSGIDFALDRGGSIAGRVIDAVTAAPLTPVSIFFYDAGGMDVTSRRTDPGGNYVSPALPPGNYFVRTLNSLGYFDQLHQNVVCFPFCAPTDGTAVAVTAGNTANVDFGLRRGGRVGGSVTDAETGAPLAGVGVSVIRGSGEVVANVSTDAGGQYLTPFLPAGTYSVRTSNASGYTDESETPVDVEDEQTTTVDFDLSRPGAIAGRISDATTGAPIPSTIVELYSFAGVLLGTTGIDSSGDYLFASLAPGAYFVRTSAPPGYVDEVYDDIPCESCPVASGTPVNVTAGATTTGIDLELLHPARVRGRVTDRDTGAPIAGADVLILLPSTEIVDIAETDASGNYATEAVPPGTYSARVTSLPEYYFDQLYSGIDCYPCEGGTPVVVTADAETTGVDFAVLRGGGNIAGRVADEATNLPLAGVNVMIHDDRGRLRGGDATDASGSYRTSVLKPGTYFVGASDAPGYVNELHRNLPCVVGFNGCVGATTGTPVAVTAAATTTIGFALGRAAISGTVIDAVSGAPLADVGVSVHTTAGAFVNGTTTNGSGVYMVSVPLGTYVARTTNSSGYFDELYDDIPCSPSCTLTAGTPIAVTSEGVTGGIDIALRPGGRISGRVTDADTGAPLASVTVWVHAGSGTPLTTGFTDASGNWVSAGLLAPGTYFVRTSNPHGYIDELYDDFVCVFCTVSSGTPVPVTGGDTTPNIDFALSRGGRVGGTVTDAVSGAPLAGVNVSILSATEFYASAFTDASGNYLTTTGLPAGTYFARTSNTLGYVDELYHDVSCFPSCTLTNGTPISVTAGSTTSDVDFALAAGGTITGRVTDASSGAAIGGARVAIVDPLSQGSFVDELSSVTTDATGTYTLTGLVTGAYYLRASTAAGHIPQVHSGIACFSCDALAFGTAVEVGTGATTSAIDFALVPGGRITGRVTDSGTGAGVAGVLVSLFLATGAPAVGTANTDASGDYTIAGLPSGTYSARTSNSEGLIDVLRTAIAVTTGATTGGIDFALSSGGRVAGRVTDAGTGEPLSGVTINISDAAGVLVTRAITDESGNYLSRGGLAAGTYSATALNTLGYLGQTYGAPISVTAGTTTGIDFALSAGGRISGRVTDVATGMPLSGVRVRISDAGGRTVTTEFTDGTGFYVSRAVLATGAYFAAAFAPRYVDGLYNGLSCPNCPPVTGTPISVTAGDTTANVDFALVEGGRIGGTVTDAATGVAVAGASVWIYDASGRYLTLGTTDFSGRYVIEAGLPAGTYYATAETYARWTAVLYDDLPCPGVCPVYTGTPIAVVPGTTTGGIDFSVLRGGTISGRIRDAATSVPINARVEVYDASGAWASAGFTDAAGTYALFYALREGTYFVRTRSSSGYVNELYDGLPWTGANATSGTPVAVTVDAVTGGIDFALSPGGRIAGRVTDASTSAPLRGVSIVVYDSSGNAVSTASSRIDGTYTTPDGLTPGTYYVRTRNSAGYVNRLYASAVCLGACGVLAGTPVVVSGTATTQNIDFALDRGARIAGRVTASGSDAALAGVIVALYDADGDLVSSATADAVGNYITPDGVPTGTYYAATSNAQGYVNEIHEDMACTASCAPAGGTPLSLTAGSTRTGIDFALDVDPDPDGDGIASTVDRAELDGSDQSAAFSGDFNDTPIGGITTGTIAVRGGDVTVRDVSPGGVQAWVAGAGATAHLSVCASGSPEGVVLDVAGERAEVACEAGGGTTVRALLATPVLQLRKPLSGAGTVVDLSTGQRATLGSPVVADPGNTLPIFVRFVDDAGVTFGSVRLDPGESIDAILLGGSGVQLTVLSGIVEVTAGDETAVLRTGETGTFGVPPDEPVLAVGGASVDEGDSGTMSLEFTVTLTGTATQTVTVEYMTENGTATAGSDYTAAGGTLIFEPGTTMQTVTVAIHGDTAIEPDETFTLVLGDAANASIGTPEAAGTIRNDDGGADLSVTKTIQTPGPYFVGNHVAYTITVSNAGPAVPQNVVVTDIVPGGTAFVSATASQGTCSGTVTVTCTIGTLAAGASATIELTLRIDAPGTIANVAQATSELPDPAAGNDAGTAVIAAASAPGIPTLSEAFLLALIAAFAAIAALRLRS